MKLTLYEIQLEFIQLAETIISNGGEVTEFESEALQINKENLQNKAVNYGFVCKQLEAENEMIDVEIKRLSALKTARTRTIDKLKDTLSAAMQIYELEEVKTPIIKINFRKSESVEIYNMSQLDQRFVVEKVTLSPDKILIKSAIKAGEDVTGARIIEHKNLQIK